jgi:hypothetical protein
MKLAEQRWSFCQALMALEHYAAKKGYRLVRDEGRVFQTRPGIGPKGGPKVKFQDRVHIPKSYHYQGLAQDYILYDSDWKPMEKWSEGWQDLGTFWLALHPECTWGGSWAKKDLGHFSWGER